VNLSYRLLNVFTDGDDPFSGNPLCVFEDATGLSDKDMQNLARQMNLSETTFVTSAHADATAKVRIFTPNYEMPFAGHPTLGTAYVVHELFGGGDSMLLRMPAGDIPVQVTGNVWTLQANPPASLPVDVPRSNLTAMIGLTADRVAAEPLWVDTGTVQLILPLKSAEDVRAAAADPRLLVRFATRPGGESLVYLWAPTGTETIEATSSTHPEQRGRRGPRHRIGVCQPRRLVPGERAAGASTPHPPGECDRAAFGP
jgi:trans-2,3-dihydro-3-hydroxyanthranilate isomerase